MALELVSRKLLEITGKDKKTFLQGLITNDINLLSEENAIFSAFLNPQGRFLADFFLYQYNDKIIIDIDKKFTKNFITKFNLYKLSAEVAIKEIIGKVILVTEPEFLKDNFLEIQEGNSKIVKDQIFTIDNRSKNLGVRVILLNKDDYNSFSIEENSEHKYHLWRIKHNVIEGSEDLTVEKSIILEFNYHKIPAINFDKGCYLGQELMTRTYRVGVIRKQPYNIIIKTTADSIAANTDIIDNNKKIGVICSAYKQGKNFVAIALCRNKPPLNAQLDAKADEKITIQLI